MTPAGGELRIELKGNLAAMLRATVQRKRAPETEALSLQVSMVAGARNANERRFHIRVNIPARAIVCRRRAA